MGDRSHTRRVTVTYLCPCATTASIHIKKWFILHWDELLKYLCFYYIGIGLQKNPSRHSGAAYDGECDGCGVPSLARHIAALTYANLLQYTTAESEEACLAIRLSMPHYIILKYHPLNYEKYNNSFIKTEYSYTFLSIKWRQKKIFFCFHFPLNRMIS